MESQKSVPERIGKQIYDLKGNTFAEILADSSKYRKAVKKYGVIILKGKDLSPSEMKEFAQRFGDEIVETSPNNKYGNFDQKHPYLFRVGNILANGTVKKDSKKEQSIWHQDLNNHPHFMTHSISLLQTKTQPMSGGGTQFLDLVVGWKAFKKNHPELINEMRKTRIQIQPDELIKMMGYAKSMENLGASQHPLLAYNERLGKELLYIGIANNQVTTLLNPLPVAIEDIIEEIEEADSIFHLVWEEGDLVIWDNDQVMHRSAADFEGERLLFRVTVRQFQEDFYLEEKIKQAEAGEIQRQLQLHRAKQHELMKRQSERQQQYTRSDPYEHRRHNCNMD